MEKFLYLKFEVIFFYLELKVKIFSNYLDFMKKKKNFLFII